MSIISYALSGNYKRFNNNLKKISKKENISMFKLKNKFIYCLITKGCGFSDYLNYELYNKTKKELKEYVTVKDQDKFYEIVSPSEYKKFFTIKPDFLVNFKKYIDRDFFYQNTITDLKRFLKNNSEFMIKPIDGLGGHGVSKMTSNDVNNIEEFYEYLNTNNMFLEGYVIQHKKISEICSESVNTLRIMTFGYNGKSEILFAALRVGNGKCNVDNFHNGGMGILIDIETGKLVGDAIDKDLNHFKKHPKTNFKFDGFILPNWDIIKKTVLEAALVNDKIHVVGWDVAITDSGCTFIEGNRRPGFDLVQVLSKCGRKDIMRKCLKQINEEEGKNYKI